MKIKELYLWQMMNLKKSIYIFYTVIYLVYILGYILIAVSDAVNMEMSVSSAIFSLVSGLVFYFETFKFGMCNGISRKTMLIAQIGTTLSICAILTLVDSFNVWIFSMIVNKPDPSIFNAIYSNESILSTMLWRFGIYMLFAMIGYFIATLNSRLTKLMSILFYVSIPAIFIVGLPMIISVLSADTLNALGRFFDKIYNFLKSSPYNMLLIALIISAILYLFSVLLVRRAPLKTV